VRMLVWSVADPDGRMGSGIANLNAVTMRKQVGPGIEAEPGRERLRIERDRPWTISVRHLHSARRVRAQRAGNGNQGDGGKNDELARHDDLLI
jgi:hypothetical protein